MRIPRTVKMIVISPTVRPKFTGGCGCAPLVGVGLAVAVCNAVGVWDTGDQRGVGAMLAQTVDAEAEADV